MFPTFLLALWLAIVCLSSLVSGQLPEYSILNSEDGRTPCDLEQTMKSACPGTKRRRSLESSEISAIFTKSLIKLRASVSGPSPTSCTCNNVFFNLWSACLITTDNASSTVSSADWTARCNSASIALSTISYEIENPLPLWSYKALPANASFDILAAISMAQQNDEKATTGSWGTIQIAVPVIVGVAVALLCGLAFWIYRRRKMRSKYWVGPPKRHSTHHRFRLFMTGRRKVREGNRDGSWVIDSQQQQGPPDNHSIHPSTKSGHQRLSSSSSLVEPGTLRFHHEKSTWAMPGKTLWKSSLRGLGTVADLLQPWKAKPIKVRSAIADPRFAIDATNRSTKTDSTLTNYRQAGFRTSGLPVSPPSRMTHETQVILEEVEEDDHDSSEEDFLANLPRGDNDDEDDISEPLIPRSPDSVLLISQGGRNFTLESGDIGQVEVVPPSPEAVAHPPPRTRLSRHRSHRRTPPAPSYPAPLPPVAPSSPSHTRRPSTGDSSLPPLDSPPVQLINFSMHNSASRKPSNDSSPAPLSLRPQASAESLRSTRPGLASPPYQAHNHMRDDSFGRPGALPPGASPPYNAVWHDRDQIYAGHQRYLSAESLPGLEYYDPPAADSSALFPGAVRAAGYPHGRNGSSDSMFARPY
ncbi:hypothetical protein C8J56DRAFT_103682 [Mycena floridula]|nr:hypothetical protein C8J56DRAFT_103682 [Mycena floridula]